MPITYRDGSSVALNGILQSNTITLTIPATIQVGDCMLWLYTGGAAVTGAPSGFTLLQSGSSNSNVFGALYFRIATAGNAGAPKGITATAAKLNSLLVAFAGCDVTSPIVTSTMTTESTSTTTHAAPSVVSAVPGRLVEMLSLRDTSAAVSSVWTPPSPALSRETVTKAATAAMVGVAADTVAPDIAAGTYGGNWVIDVASQNAVMFGAFLLPAGPPAGPSVSGRKSGAWQDSDLFTRESGNWV